jgi:hypothetical protein
MDARIVPLTCPRLSITVHRQVYDNPDRASLTVGGASSYAPVFPTPAIATVASRGPRSTVRHWTAPIIGHHLERDPLVMRRSGVRFPEAARPITPSQRPLARPARRRSAHYRLSVSEMSRVA